MGSDDLWVRRHNAFRRRIYATASLSNVDGAVVFSRDLRLMGFGAEILVTDAMAQASPQIFTNAKTGKPWPTQDPKALGGTRHRSAFRLCQVIPNSLAFVVSQDGPLSVFHSIPGKLFAWGFLEPRA